MRMLFTRQAKDLATKNVSQKWQRLSNCAGHTPNKGLLSPLRGWDGLSAASRLQVRPKAGRYFRLIVNVAILIKSATFGRNRKAHIVELAAALVRCRFWVLC